MAGSATVSLNKIKLGNRDVQEIICDWTSDATGLVVQNIATALYASGLIDSENLCGNLLAIESSPGESGDRSTTIPVNLTDHTFLDDYGFDLGESNFLNMATAAASKKYCEPTFFVNGTIQLNISSTGGDALTGRDILWIEVYNN